MSSANLWGFPRLSLSSLTGYLHSGLDLWNPFAVLWIDFIAWVDTPHTQYLEFTPLSITQLPELSLVLIRNSPSISYFLLSKILFPWLVFVWSLPILGPFLWNTYRFLLFPLPQDLGSACSSQTSKKIEFCPAFTVTWSNSGTWGISFKCITTLELSIRFYFQGAIFLLLASYMLIWPDSLVLRLCPTIEVILPSFCRWVSQLNRRLSSALDTKLPLGLSSRLSLCFGVCPTYTTQPGNSCLLYLT